MINIQFKFINENNDQITQAISFNECSDEFYSCINYGFWFKTDCNLNKKYFILPKNIIRVINTDPDEV